MVFVVVEMYYIYNIVLIGFVQMNYGLEAEEDRESANILSTRNPILWATLYITTDTKKVMGL